MAGTQQQKASGVFGSIVSRSLYHRQLRCLHLTMANHFHDILLDTVSSASTVLHSRQVSTSPKYTLLMAVTKLILWRLSYSTHTHLSFQLHVVYSPEMPASIPPTILIRRAFDKVSHGIQFFLRGILVAFIWLVILPYFTIWIWRLYFWIGETFAFRANGLETPMWNTTTFFSSRHNLTAAPSTSSGKDKTLDGISILLFQSIAPEHQWIR